jgi:hypothetical protein
VTAYWVPIINAAMELKENNPAAAVEVLEKAIPYELSDFAPESLGTL